MRTFNHVTSTHTITFDFVPDEALRCYLTRLVANDAGTGGEDRPYIADVAALDADTLRELGSRLGINAGAPNWWLSPTGTRHTATCTCRPATLIEAVMAHLPDHMWRSAVDAHYEALARMWCHYWSGERAVSDQSDLLGDACALCIGDSERHLDAVYNDAQNLAGEFGEFAASFDFAFEFSTPILTYRASYS